MQQHRARPVRNTAALVAAATLLLAALPARGSGFLLYEQSARGIGMGSGLSASVRDPSAVWFNPAALTDLAPVGASLTAALVAPNTRFSPAAGGPAAESRTGLRVVPNVFAHARLAERLVAGIGVFAPFGLIVDWPEDWVGKERSLQTDLRVINVNPTVAFQITDRVSVGAGANVARGTVELASALPFAAGRADLSGGAWGFGANAAVLVRLLPERLHLAATYRSRMRLAFAGDAKFTLSDERQWRGNFPDQGAHATITLPDILVLGGMWRPHPRLEIAAEVNWVLWSTFDELNIDFELDRPAFPAIARTAVDPFTARLGGEWSLGGAWGLSVRAGASFDQSASHRDTLAPSAPDAHRLAFGAGIGFARGPFTVDVGYLYAHFLPAEAAGPNAQPEGTYRSRAHVFALTVGARTGR